MIAKQEDPAIREICLQILKQNVTVAAYQKVYELVEAALDAQAAHIRHMQTISTQQVEKIRTLEQQLSHAKAACNHYKAAYHVAEDRAIDERESQP
jgi:hypothetical protein